MATATLRVTGDGPITIIVTYISFNAPAYPSAAVINLQGGAPVNPVSKLKLIPTKAYRHVHDPATVTVLASDASNNPVSGAKVVFSVAGDCKPSTDATVKTTDANGIATIMLYSNEKGVASVVAAGVDATGAPVLSSAAHVIFFEHKGYAEEREREYFGEGRDM